MRVAESKERRDTGQPEPVSGDCQWILSSGAITKFVLYRFSIIVLIRLHVSFKLKSVPPLAKEFCLL